MSFLWELCRVFAIAIITIKHNGQCQKIPYRIGNAVVMVDSDTLLAVQPLHEILKNRLDSKSSSPAGTFTNSKSQTIKRENPNRQELQVRSPHPLSFAVNDESLLDIKIISGITSLDPQEQMRAETVDDSLVNQFRAEMILGMDKESEVHRVLQENFDESKTPAVIAITRENIARQEDQNDAKSEEISMKKSDIIKPANEEGIFKNIYKNLDSLGEEDVSITQGLPVSVSVTTNIEKQTPQDVKDGDGNKYSDNTGFQNANESEQENNKPSIANVVLEFPDSISESGFENIHVNQPQSEKKKTHTIVEHVTIVHQKPLSTSSYQEYQTSQGFPSQAVSQGHHSSHPLQQGLPSQSISQGYPAPQPQSHSSSHSVSQGYTPPKSHSSSHSVSQGYTPPQSHSSSHSVFQGYTPPQSHSSSHSVSQGYTPSQPLSPDHPSSHHSSQVYPPSSQTLTQLRPPSQTVSQGHPSSQPIPQGYPSSQSVVQEHPSLQPISYVPPSSQHVVQGSSQPVSQGFTNSQSVSQVFPSSQHVPQVYPSSQHMSQGYPSPQPVSQGYPSSQPSSQGYISPQPESQGFPSPQPESQGYPSSQPLSHGSSQPVSHGYPSSQPVSQGYPSSQPVSQGYSSSQPASHSSPSSSQSIGLPQGQKYPSKTSDYGKIIEKLTEKIEKDLKKGKPNRNINKNKNENKNKYKQKNKNKNKNINRRPYGKNQKMFETVVGRLIEALEEEAENTDGKTSPYLIFTLNEIKSRSMGKEPDKNLDRKYIEDGEHGKYSDSDGQNSESFKEDSSSIGEQNNASKDQDDSTISNSNVADELSKKYEEIIKDIANIIATSIIEIVSPSDTPKETEDDDTETEIHPSDNIILQILNKLKKKYPNGIFAIEKKIPEIDKEETKNENFFQSRFSEGALIDRLTEKITNPPIFTDSVGKISKRKGQSSAPFPGLYASHARENMESYGNERKYHRVVIKEENGKTKLIHNIFDNPEESEFVDKYETANIQNDGDGVDDGVSETQRILDAEGERDYQNSGQDERYAEERRGAGLRTLTVRGRKIAMNESFACGVPEKQRIIGGQIADIKQHPWMIQMLFRRTKDPFCGGTIINNKYILTAAHCLNFITANKVLVRIEHTRPGQGTEGKIVVPEKFIIHSKYKDSVIEKYDIGLIKLKKSLQYNEKALPICMPPTADSKVNGITGLISGWGIFEEGSRSPSDVLREAFVKISDQERCKKESNYKAWELNDSVVCARETKIDSCQGDSGGPLNYVIEQYGIYAQAGITSWGLGCAREKYPGVYTKVSYYYDWILKHTADAVWSCHPAWNKNCETYRRVQPIQEAAA